MLFQRIGDKEPRLGAFASDDMAAFAFDGGVVTIGELGGPARRAACEAAGLGGQVGAASRGTYHFAVFAVGPRGAGGRVAHTRNSSGFPE